MKTFACLAAAAAALVAAPALAADLTIAFPAAAPQGQILVALFDSEASYGGQGQPVRHAVIDAARGDARAVFDGLPDGDYAIRVFHDLNGDGRMNTNPFGMPVEPYAFSNNAVGAMGPATWAQARFTVSGDAPVQTIDLK